MEDDNDNGNNHNSEMALMMKEISWKAKAMITMIKAIMIIKINSEQLKQIAMQFQSTGNNINWRGVWNKALSDFWRNVKFS